MATFGSLTITSPDGRQQTIGLDKPVVTLGREVDNDVQLGDPKASRHHARLECDQNGCTLVDLGSANGTMLRGQRIESARLSSGDVFIIGDSQVTFSAPPGAGGSASRQTLLDRAQAPSVAPAPARQARRFPLTPVLLGLGALVVLGVCAAAAVFLLAGGSASVNVPLAPAPTLPPPAQPSTDPAQQPPAAPPAGQTQQQPASSPGGGCVDDSEFLADVTIPDGTLMLVNEPFTKTWTILNDGSCAWDGYSLVWISGARMSAPASVPLPHVDPGGQINVSVDLVAPSTPGEYRANFQIQNASGVRFADMPYVIIVAQ